MRFMPVALLIGSILVASSPVQAKADLPLIDAVRAGDEVAVQTLLSQGGTAGWSSDLSVAAKGKVYLFPNPLLP